jgi:hypothetical protein
MKAVSFFIHPEIQERGNKRLQFFLILSERDRKEKVLFRDIRFMVWLSSCYYINF